LLSVTISLGHVSCSKVSIQLSARQQARELTEKVENTAGVAPLIVVPGDELHEVVVQRDTGLGVEDGRAWVAVQIGGDDIVLGVSEYA
jgi:hypothetical protein